jgi:hypothetical protein
VKLANRLRRSSNLTGPLFALRAQGRSRCRETWHGDCAVRRAHRNVLLLRCRTCCALSQLISESPQQSGADLQPLCVAVAGFGLPPCVASDRATSSRGERDERRSRGHVWRSSKLRSGCACQFFESVKRSPKPGRVLKRRDWNSAGLHCAAAALRQRPEIRRTASCAEMPGVDETTKNVASPVDEREACARVVQRVLTVLLVRHGTTPVHMCCSHVSGRRFVLARISLATR